MSNKKQLLREVVEYSDDSVKELYNYANQLDWMQVDQPDIFNEYLSDDKFMLSVFHQIRRDSTITLEEELKQGWFDVLPFVYYDFYEMDQRYIKNIDATEKQMNKLADRRQRLTEKGNQITMQNEDKLEANKKSISKVTEEIIEKHGQIHEKYNVGVPYSIKELIFSKEESENISSVYESQNYDSLKLIREECRNDLIKINKYLYRKVLQCSPQSNLNDIKGLLSWLIAGEYKSQNYLYFLDKELLLNLEGIEDAENCERLIKNLNHYRRLGAEKHFRIKLLDYLILCKKIGEKDMDIGGFNYLYANKPNSNAGYVPAKEVDETPNPWNQLDEDQKKLVSRAISGKGKDGRSKYKIEEYRAYLAIHLLSPKNRSRASKRDEAAKCFTGEAKERMKKVDDGRLSNWEKWLK